MTQRTLTTEDPKAVLAFSNDIHIVATVTKTEFYTALTTEKSLGTGKWVKTTGQVTVSCDGEYFDNEDSTEHFCLHIKGARIGPYQHVSFEGYLIPIEDSKRTPKPINPI